MPNNEAESETRSAVVHLDDRRILPRHALGDPGAFPELVRLFGGRVFAYLTRTGVPAADRDGLFQEIFWRAHKSAGSYAPDRALDPWIFAIVINTTRSWFRARKIRSVVETRTDLDARAANGPHAADLAEARRTATFMDEALATLPEAQRDVVLLCCIEGLDQRDVAELLGMPISTVKTNLRRARLSLASALQRRKLVVTRETQS